MESQVQDKPPPTCDICDATFSSLHCMREHMKYKHIQSKQWKCKICDKYFSQQGSLIQHTRIHTGFKFECIDSKCDKKFRNNSEMKLHFSRFHDENPVMKHVCKICDKGFFKKSDLNVHLVKHTGAKPYECLSCSKSFTVKNNLRKHEKNYCAQGNQDLTFKCMNCPSVFNGKEKLQRHLKRHDEKSRSKYDCGVCDFITDCKDYLKIHVFRMHNTTTNVYPCDGCDKKFSLETDLRRHKKSYCKSIGDNLDFKCLECPSMFNSSSKLQSHHRWNHIKDILFNAKCTECGQEFTEKGQFINHKKKHLPQISVACDICNSKFTSNGNLNYHVMHVHSKPTVIKCEICSKSYSHKSSLALHKKREHEESLVRNQVCEYCDKKFWIKFELEKHIRTHTGAKPYKCQHCGKAFGNNSNFLKHQRENCVSSSKDLEFKCKKCPKSFNGAQKLKAHQGVHKNSSSSFKCDTCNRIYKYDYVLKRHMKIKHSEHG